MYAYTYTQDILPEHIKMCIYTVYFIWQCICKYILYYICLYIEETIINTYSTNLKSLELIRRNYGKMKLKIHFISINFNKSLFRHFISRCPKIERHQARNFPWSSVLRHRCQHRNWIGLFLQCGHILSIHLMHQFSQLPCKVNTK